jgi:hypothetical protein
MPRLRHTVEQILAKLREAEVALAVRGSRLPCTQYHRTHLLLLAQRVRRPQGGSNQAAQRPGTGENLLEVSRRRPFTKECKTPGDVACVNKPHTTWNC